MRRLLILLGFVVAGCDLTIDTTPAPIAGSGGGQVPSVSPVAGPASFAGVVQAVEPVAERECLARTRGVNCDFLIQIHPDPRAPANAYQSLDRNGRPVITFTRAMLSDLENTDELAFVMSHEAAHHIQGHLARQQQNAISGAIIFGGLATLAGANPNDVANAQDLGAQVGARSYSKDFELEADQLGTIITHKAGYRPSVGVLFFARLPDPGDRFLGTHPANPDRVRIVQQTIQRYNLN